MAIRTLCSGLALTALLASPASATLKHLYTFNDGTVTDSIAGANGTLEGGAVIVAAGRFAYCPDPLRVS